MQGLKLRYKLYTNVSDFTGNRTVPSMDNSNAARVPSPPLLLYRIVKYEYSYCKVLYLPYYRIEPTTVPTVQADLMMALVAVIRDLLCEFLSKSLGEKLR